MATQAEIRMEMRVNLVKNFVGGLMAVPVSLALQNKVASTWWVPLAVFFGATLGTFLNTFMETLLKKLAWGQSFCESFSAVIAFIAGGFFPMLCGILIKDRYIRIAVVFSSTCLISGAALASWKFSAREEIDENEHKQMVIRLVIVWFIVVAGCAIFVAIEQWAK